MSLKQELADPVHAADLQFVCSRFAPVASLFAESQPANRTEAAETCSLWALRFNKCLLNSVADASASAGAGAGGVPLPTEPTLAAIDALIDLAIHRWSSGDPNYKAALKKFFASIFAARARIAAHANAPANAPPANAAAGSPPPPVAPFVATATSYAQDDARICYGVLDCLARCGAELRSEVVAALPAMFLEQSFGRLVADDGEGANAHLIGRCLVALLGAEPPAVWFEHTRRYIASPSTYQPCMTYFVQPALRQHPSAPAAFAEYYALCRDEQLLRDPSVEIGVLKAAKNAKIDVGSLVQQSETVRRALLLADKRLRYDALALLCAASRKLTAPVPPMLVAAVVNAGPALLAEGDPKSRSDVCGALRQLLIRLDASRTDKTPLCDFIAAWCAQSLVPGAPYRCLAMATRLLDLFKFDFREYGYLVKSLLNGGVLSDYADIRGQCVALLEQGSSSSPGGSSHGGRSHIASAIGEQFDSVRTLAFELLQSSRGGDAGARILQLLHAQFPEQQLVAALVADLERKLDEAAADVQAASTRFAVHGYFIALRLLQQFNLTSVALVERAWQICTPPLMALAPEGMHENTLNFCWKTCKECALLIESCGSSSSSSSSSSGSGSSSTSGGGKKSVLTEANPRRLLDEMARMLADMTHWGAFSSIPPAFVAVARCDPEHALQLVWNQIGELESREKSRSVTRRSAGLPMLVASALTAKFDPKVVTALFKLATLPFAEGEAEELEMPQVHGMNCLRAVMQDATLTKATAEFVESGVQLALQQFRSQSWSLRNCAAMLFTGLFKRLFGVRGVNMPASVFFQRFRSLKGVVLTQLLLAVEHERAFGSPDNAVFPALGILAQLQTVGATDKSLAVFWEPIVELLGSPSWKVREMAARVVGAMTPADSAADCVGALVDSIGGDTTSTNLVHGYALAINQLLAGGGPDVQVEEPTRARIASIIRRSRCMEVSTALMWAYKLSGGTARVVPFRDLPHLPHLNPSVASFEAEQVTLDDYDGDNNDVVRRYAHGWSPVLRALPAARWSPWLALAVARDASQLPDIRAIALRALQAISLDISSSSSSSSSSSAAETELAASQLMSPTEPLEVRCEALILHARNPGAEFVGCVVKFAVDESPVECRRSAVQSIKAYFARPAATTVTGGSGAGSGSGGGDSLLLYALYRLLSDDEDDIRISAAETVSSLAKSPSSAAVLAPAVCERSVLERIDPAFLTAQLAHNLVEDARESILVANASSTLFVVEEESLFRDEMRSIRMQGEFCAPASVEQRAAAEEAAKIVAQHNSTLLFTDSSKDLFRVRARVDALLKKTHKQKHK